MDESRTMRVTVEEAATLLDIEKGSVKKRIQRGKLRSEKDARGTTWVYVDESETVRDESQGRSATDSNELVSELRDRLRYLEGIIATRDEEIRRRDVIISQLTERIPELPAPVGEARAEPQEPTESPTEATEQPGRVDRSRRLQAHRRPQSAPGGGVCSKANPQTPLSGGPERPGCRRARCCRRGIMPPRHTRRCVLER